MSKQQGHCQSYFFEKHRNWVVGKELHGGNWSGSKDKVKEGENKFLVEVMVEV